MTRGQFARYFQCSTPRRGARAVKTWPRLLACAEYPRMRAFGSRLLFISLSCCFQASCLQIGNPTDSGTADNAGTAGAAGSSTGTRVTGTNCGVDPSSGVSLCLGISSCPTVRVDPEQFPDCGYRISGSLIDLQCLCGDSLCPIGAAASCLDAKALLSDQSGLGICARVADGRCELVKQTSNSGPSTCEKDCRAQCAGVPGCIQLCGC